MFFLMWTFVVAFVLKSSKGEDIFKTVDALVGQSAELPCNTTAENGDKLNVLIWYKNGSSTAFYSYDRHQPNAPLLSGRYRLLFDDENGVSNLQILKVRPGDAGVYHCSAEFTSSPTLKTFLLLNVIEPPLKLWVVYENGTHVTSTNSSTNTSKSIGPYYVGETIHLFCVVYGGKPSPSISWWDEERQLKNTSTPLSTRRARTNLRYGPLRKEDHGKVLTCYAVNYEDGPSLAISVVVDMYLPPELLSVRVSRGDISGRVLAGQQLAAQCRVLGARPTPQVVWRLGADALHADQNVTREPSQRLVVSEISLSIKAEDDESLLTCCVPSYTRVQDEIVCAQGIPLTVLYPPKLNIISPQGEVINNTLTVVKGSDLTLNCSNQANPPIYKLVWFHREDIYNPTSDETPDIQPSIEMKAVTEEDGGEYACAATNDVDSLYSKPVVVDVTYPPYCADESISEYGVGEGDSVNLICNVISNPPPKMFRWVVVNEATNASMLKSNLTRNVVENEECSILYQRPNGTNFSTVFCWGLNNVSSTSLPNTPCTFLVTDQTVPRPPKLCTASRVATDISITCEKAHDGGLPQKFKLAVMSKDEELIIIKNLDPEFKVQEPKKDEYKFIIIAYNEKGESETVEIGKDGVIDVTTVEAERGVGVVTNITTLSLALCGGVALLALLACGLVLCARDAGGVQEPPLCAYNTEESNCETCPDSDDSCVRRASFRRAVRPPDVRRSTSFHAARPPHDDCGRCRVRSLQNIRSRDHLEQLGVTLPPDVGYSVPQPMNTFYTLPKKMRHRPREISDEVSEITQTSDGFSLPPPPDEFSTYRAGTKIKDVPNKPSSTYGTIRRKSVGKVPMEEQYTNVMISPLNTVGLPTISGQTTLYSYPDDHQGVQKSSGILTTFQSNSSPRESGI